MTASDAATLRASLAAAALAEIPKLLTLQDRSPASPTHGCFDRAYWHYRKSDFPSGMSQEYVLPLALAWALDMPDNPYRGQPAIRDWIEAGIRFAARSSHANGACDDYYPFEQAAGATAFSLLACLDAAALIGLNNELEINAFFHTRAHWLANHEESGRLSNHEALIVACLARMAERESGRWEDALSRRTARLLSWQHEEGWFDEYGGADPGYLSLTIGLLADTDRRRPDLGLREPCRRAIRFLATLAHPDGTIGGEYTSRATRNFFPHGLEIAGSWCPDALALSSHLLRPLAGGRAPCFADDYIIGHHLWSWMLAWREWHERRPARLPVPEGRQLFDGACLLVDARAGTTLYCGWSRGAAFRLYDGDRLLVSDTGPTLVTRRGRVAVTHLEGPTELSIGDDHVEAAGVMAWAKSARLTPGKSALLRLLMLTLGRLWPHLVRRFLQTVLVTGRRDAPFRFRRRIAWRDGGWDVVDAISPRAGWGQIRAAWIGGYQTSVTTVMARVWQADQLTLWLDLGDRLAGLEEGQPLVVERRFEASAR
jgi:hypothetical protein